MRLYDEVISTWQGLCAGAAALERGQKARQWPDAGSHQMILRGDMAYELGGSVPSLYALGGTAVTDDPGLVGEDEVALLGPDIGEIKGDISFARLSMVLVDDTNMGDGNALYNAVKRIENVRYHVNPEGYMMRVSAVMGRESIRVSKKAVGEGLGFACVGDQLIRRLHADVNVKAAKIVFITEPDFDYAGLSRSVKKAADITAAIDHILKEAMTDCRTCALSPVCDEVEGLREMHFKKAEGDSKAL